MTDVDIDFVAPVVTGPIHRSFAIDDLVVRTEGDGRTVEAYAAVFGQPTEIRDQYGHYYESIDRTAFDGVLKRGAKPKVMFNHARDIFGNPSDKWSAPVAVHRSAVADGRGLRVSSWYVKTPAGDEALELVRSGAVDGFSFSGKPNRSRTIAAARGEDLPTIVRQELSLSEYGPAVFRAYDDARVLAVRSQQIADQIGDLTPDQLAELVDVLRSRLPDLADFGRSGSPSDADASVSPLMADSEFNRHRREIAARIRGVIPPS
jgi:HK97 family phage prohead protease